MIGLRPGTQTAKAPLGLMHFVARNRMNCRVPRTCMKIYRVKRGWGGIGTYTVLKKKREKAAHVHVTDN